MYATKTASGKKDCDFTGPEHVMAVHRLKHMKAADGSSLTESAEEERAWMEARREQFPSRRNLKRKAESEDKRR
eukprot:3709972-Amphidinium_carterae.1